MGRIGCHFVFRELVRRKFVTNAAIYPYCFVPYRAVAEGADVTQESQAIWEKVKNAIGEENATFGEAFDIAITAYLRDHSR